MSETDDSRARLQEPRILHGHHWAELRISESSWVEFKKPILSSIPVLDPQKLTTGQLKQLAASYGRVAYERLKPLSQMAADGVRAEIDRTLAAVLRLPDYSILRTLLAQELVIFLKRL